MTGKKIPVKEGQSWTTDTKVGDQQLTMTGRQGRNEEVQVPAGKYQAVTAVVETTVDGKNGKEVAQALNMTVAAVYLAKSRVMAQLKEQIRQLREERGCS